MKLSEFQVEIRKSFRANVLTSWGSRTPAFYHIVNAMADQFHISLTEMYEQLRKIPSIGDLPSKLSSDVWLANNYPKTSNVMFDSGDIVKALKIWKDEKRCQKIPKRTVSERVASAEMTQSIRFLNAKASLGDLIGDRYQKTAWNKCK